jgi:hypothetical protein
MKRLLAAIVLAVTLLTAAPSVPAEAHSPGCTFAFIYPYLYLSRAYYGQVFLDGEGPYHWWKYTYVSVSTNLKHRHNCYFLVGLTEA